MLYLLYRYHITVVAMQVLLPEVLLGSGAWLGSMPDRASIHGEINVYNQINNIANVFGEIAHTQHRFYH